MNNKYKRWGIGVIIILVISIAIGFIIFKPNNEESEKIKTPIADEGESKTTEKIIDNSIEKPAESSTENKKEQSRLTIFTADIDTYDKKETESIKVDQNKSITEKLTLIADTLSQTQFNNLPIKIQGLEQVEGKTIAIINLCEKEKKSQQDKTWIQYLNAGSTGSQITIIAFEESFLQRDLEEEWIDGMKIIYEGENIEAMDHFPGTHIIYRAK